MNHARTWEASLRCPTCDSTKSYWVQIDAYGRANDFYVVAWYCLGCGERYRTIENSRTGGMSHALGWYESHPLPQPELQLVA